MENRGEGRLIVTSSQGLLRAALCELVRVDPATRELRRFGAGIFLTQGTLAAGDLARRLHAEAPMFIKHIMPAPADVPLTGDRETDLQGIVQAALVACRLAPSTRFAVQCRLDSASLRYRAKDVEVAVGSAFEAAGCEAAFSDWSIEGQEAERIVSIFVSGLRCYLGCSTAEENLSPHCDEYRIRSRTGKSVSRAERKLEEAIGVFNLEVALGRALDLGACPGGWTRVLAARGMSVVAVDRGALDRGVASLPGVSAIRSSAESYRPDGVFDLVVNDMNLRPEDSAHLMARMCESLKPGGWAVMTAKLNGGDPEERVAATLVILRETLEVTGVRLLFHNRREVTICLRKPTSAPPPRPG